MDEEEIDFCSPIQGINNFFTVIPTKLQWILYVLNVKNVGALMLNVILFAVVKRKRTDPGIRSTAGSGSSLTADVKLARSLLLLVWVFVCSWCSSIALITTAVYLPEEYSRIVKKYIVLLALPTYCQGFFVTYSRSARYRRVYKEMLHHIFSTMFCQNSVTAGVSDVSGPPNTKAEPIRDAKLCMALPYKDS
ncbi:hypothetical protein OESDEN_09019 [Oesophagostomum dentatum]|uniref:G-protein coupled receptors family 1 profile domain-containing protein n=1 Tax=Oesophagostomum dentatum TaxID=61180 RepID=A0A0B1T5T7_OESDE|nr:hypothetical protein OESDEN_09019 [Oesophagostomum dentatum]